MRLYFDLCCLLDERFCHKSASLENADSEAVVCQEDETGQGKPRQDWNVFRPTERSRSGNGKLRTLFSKIPIDFVLNLGDSFFLLY